MALGTPGRDGIWQRLAQVMVNQIDFGMNIQEAINAPRFSYAGPQETGTSLEPVWRLEDHVPETIIQLLKSMGQEIEVVLREVGVVNGIFRDPKTGVLIGCADPRGKSYDIGY